MLEIIGLAVIAYVIGSIPFGFMVGKSRGLDLRTIGSRNIGTTNVYRALGLRIAILVFILDVTKGVVGTRVLPAVWDTGMSITHMRFICGIAVIVGSVASIFMRFRGGKGVAVAVGVFLGLQPIATAICIGIWAILVASFRYASLGSICGAAALPILIVVFERGRVGADPVFYLALVVAAIVAVRHTANIRRLIAGTENRIGRARGEHSAG
jgi:glycerol-3-phosphate acyltransferase PlsY